MLKYFNTYDNCRAVLKVWDLASGYPFWPGSPTPTKIAMRQAWVSATAAEQDTLEASGAYSGWSLHNGNGIFPVDPPGSGYVIEVPEELVTVVVPVALNQYGVSLTPEQVLLCVGALAVAQAELPPEWVPPPEDP